MFYDPLQFPFTRALRENWEKIYAEYLGVRSELVDWVETDLYDEGWQVFGLFDFPDGAELTANTKKCPVAAHLVRHYFARHGAAGFSVLAPMTRIKPHTGYQGEYLRCHLGLHIPDGDCGLRVAGEVRRWQSGDVLVFDDRVEHAAWNLTDSERVVMLIDFVPDL